MIKGKKILINLIIFSMLATTLSACKKTENAAQATDGTKQYSSNEEIELIEPKGTALSYETAAYRNIAITSIYSGYVCPDTVEYEYETDVPFGRYGAFPGDDVTKGETLITGVSEGINDEIEEIAEQNAELLESHVDYLSDYFVDLDKAKEYEFEAASAYQDMCAYAPDEESDAYNMWAKAAMPVEQNKKNAQMAREKLEQACLEHNELFDLEYAYNEKRISRLQEDIAETTVVSRDDGVVVASGYYTEGDTVPVGTNVVAIGNPSDKEILCEYISKNTIDRALDVYALINGQRYEVSYEVMESSRYKALMEENGAVYTTFKIENSPEIELGDYAVIVIVEKMEQNALCVPKDAVNKDESGHFVYLLQNNESVYTPVSVGMSDSAFMQITHGLSEGDKVLYDAPYDVGSKTHKIEKGSVAVDFKTDGFLFYPSAIWMRNPAKNGTCYIKEICVEDYEQITKGQVLCKVEVVTDNVEKDRINRKIQRQNERLVDLYNKKSQTYNEDELTTLDRAIRDRERSIEDLNKQLDKISKYSGVFDITAPFDGIVTARTELKEGELISYKQELIQVASNDSSCVIVEDEGGMLSYGNTVEVVYKDGNGGSYSATGSVVSLNPCALSKDLNIGYALIRLDGEDDALASAVGSNMSNGYWNRTRFTVSSCVRSMDNVLLIPKTAAYKAGNDTYVITKDKNGEAKLVKFYAGGADNTNYFVAYGDITEGMEICLQ